MVITLPTRIVTTEQLEDLLREVVIELTVANEMSAELQMIDEYFTLGEPDDEDEWRLDLLPLLAIVDPVCEARFEFECR